MILPLASGFFAPVAPGDRPVCWAVTGRLGGNSVGEFGQANIAPHVGDDHSATSRNLNSLAALVGVAEADLVRILCQKARRSFRSKKFKSNQYAESIEHTFYFLI